MSDDAGQTGEVVESGDSGAAVVLVGPAAT